MKYRVSAISEHLEVLNIWDTDSYTEAHDRYSELVNSGRIATLGIHPHHPQIDEYNPPILDPIPDKKRVDLATLLSSIVRPVMLWEHVDTVTTSIDQDLSFGDDLTATIRLRLTNAELVSASINTRLQMPLHIMHLQSALNPLRRMYEKVVYRTIIRRNIHES